VLTVIGCGNPLRSDDGVGSHVVAELARRLGAPADGAFQLIDAGTDGMSVMFRARGSSGLILVDACQSDAAPGTVYTVPGDQFDAPPDPGFNLHEFRWSHALHAGRRIFGEAFPADVTVYLVEAASLARGIGLSAAVERAAAEVADRIAARLRDLADAEASRVGLRLCRGALHLERAVHDRFFAGLSTVVLLRRDRDLLIMPVRHAAAGGTLIKIRNAQGDRVIDAVDFCRAQGLEDPAERTLIAAWDSEAAALRVSGIFEMTAN
jgi:hydrogenase maturation protease